MIDAQVVRQPLVTVVIPCYNTDPEHLAEALASVYAQTYRAVEIVVVDDGSTSVQTRHFLESLTTDAVRVLRQDNRGVSAARNAGMTAARGEFLLPLDGDDLLEPGYLAATVPILRDDRSVAVVSSQAEYFGHRAGLMQLPDPSLPWMLAENSIHNTSLFRREDFDRLGGYDESLTQGFEDHEWWVRLLLDGGRSHVLDDVLFRYRIQVSSRNAMASSSSDALLHLREAMLRNNPEHTIDMARMALSSLDVALDRMHASEARVAQLEHHLGPVVRAFDRYPAVSRMTSAARRAKSRLSPRRGTQDVTRRDA